MKENVRKCQKMKENVLAGYQGCAGSSIESDAGNLDSDELLHEGDSERLREARIGDHSETSPKLYTLLTSSLGKW